MSSIEPYISPHKENSSKEVSGSFVVACGNGAELLEFCKEILDEMAGFVHVFVIGTLDFPVGFWRDDGFYSGPFKWFYDSLIGVKSFVSQHSPCRYVRQKSIRPLKIASLPGRQDEIDRVAKRIDERMNFGCQSAF